MIILASTSPTRQAMLNNAGLDFTAVGPEVDERALVTRNPQWSPSQTALMLAEAKACEVSSRFPEVLVVGADQVLALGSRIYAKPSGRAECRQHLLELRGRTHALVSGVVCARGGKAEWSHTASAFLTMRRFSESFLERYLDAVGTDCTSTVGGYKIEGHGLQLFEAVNGDHFTILGLPLMPLLDHLRAKGEIPS
jgi:septum formation protein